MKYHTQLINWLVPLQKFVQGCNVRLCHLQRLELGQLPVVAQRRNYISQSIECIIQTIHSSSFSCVRCYTSFSHDFRTAVVGVLLWPCIFLILLVACVTLAAIVRVRFVPADAGSIVLSVLVLHTDSAVIIVVLALIVVVATAAVTATRVQVSPGGGLWGLVRLYVVAGRYWSCLWTGQCRRVVPAVRTRHPGWRMISV